MRRQGEHIVNRLLRSNLKMPTLEPNTLLGTAIAAHRRGNLDAVHTAHKEVLENNPQHAGTLMNLGTMHRAVGALKDALKALHRAKLKFPCQPGWAPKR